MVVFSLIFRRNGVFFVDVSSKWWFFRVFSSEWWFFVDFFAKWCKYAEKSASDNKILQNAMKINDFAKKN